MEDTPLRVLTIARNYPNESYPALGIWVQRLVRVSQAVAEQTVISPVPYVPPLLPVGRYERFRRVAKHRIDQGIEIHCPRVPFGPGMLLHRFEARLIYPFVMRVALRLHRERAFHLIHAHFIYPDGVVAARLGCLLGIPVVTTEHTLWSPWLDENRSVRRQVAQALPHIQVVSVVSRAVRESVMRFLKDESRIEILPNVVDDAFRLRARDEPWDPNQLLFVGVVRRVKGLDVLVRALARLTQNRPQLRLRVLGEPFYGGYRRDEEEVRRLITSLGLEQRVEFSGYAPPEEVARVMRRSALLVVPSRRESFSAVTVEAIASGTPVVATSCGGPEEIVSENTGRIVPTEDDEALAKAIDDVLRARPSFEGERMRSEVMARFGPDQVAARVHQIYARARNYAHQPIAASSQGV